MPYIIKHRRPPEKWSEVRKTSSPVVRPFAFVNWLGEWIAYLLGQISFLEVLEYIGSLSLLIGVIFYFLGAGDRLKQKHYQAWQVINTAQGKGGSGGRIDALQELNEDHVPLVGVDVSDAYLQEVELVGADLRRGDFRGTDLKDCDLHKSNLEGATLRSANLRNGNLAETKLVDANFIDADLTDAKLSASDVRGVDFTRADLRNTELSQLSNFQQIKSIRDANVRGVRNPPAGFVAWATKNGACDCDDEAWSKLLDHSPATQRSK